MNLPKNWKTTFAGIVLLLNLAVKVADKGVAAVMNETDAGQATMAVGLICAKDHNVTGGTKEQ